MDTPVLERGSPRRRLLVLVVVLGLLGWGLAAGLPRGGTQALRNPACGPSWVVDATADQNRNC